LEERIHPPDLNGAIKLQLGWRTFERRVCRAAAISRWVNLVRPPDVSVSTSSRVGQRRGGDWIQRNRTSWFPSLAMETSAHFGAARRLPVCVGLLVAVVVASRSESAQPSLLVVEWNLTGFVVKGESNCKTVCRAPI
jgi:hypothetical protein